MSEEDLLSELLDQEEQSSENSIDSSTSEPTSDDASQTASEQSEHEGSNDNIADKSRGVPWVDYLPELEYKVPTTLEGRLHDHYLTTVETLKVKELFILATLDQDIHDAYYRNWIKDANRLFRVAVKTKKKLSILQKPKK